MLPTAPPRRPMEYAEQALTRAFLDGTFPPGSILTSERELAAQLGITRPTLREALRRLERDGWVTIRQGKPTVVNDFWQDGGLNVLGALIRHGEHLPPDFIPNLLEIRLALVPACTRAALERSPDSVAAFLCRYGELPDTPEAFATFDWELHRTLTAASGNPLYTMILNGFRDVYDRAARLYFAQPEARTASRRFYRLLLTLAHRGRGSRAQRLTRAVMRESIALWRGVEMPAGGGGR